MKTVRTN